MDEHQHLTGFRREILNEMRYAESQLTALAQAVPAEDYGWLPVEHTRSFAAVLVHIAAGNLMLLDRAGSRHPEVVNFYSGIEAEPLVHLCAMVRRNCALEKSLTDKTGILDFLARSFAAVKECWTTATEEELWVTENFFGELETRRRVYLRILAHSHEHMGQLIAYARTMGYQVPWPDPLKNLEVVEVILSGN